MAYVGRHVESTAGIPGSISVFTSCRRREVLRLTGPRLACGSLLHDGLTEMKMSSTCLLGNILGALVPIGVLLQQDLLIRLVPTSQYLSIASGLASSSQIVQLSSLGFWEFSPVCQLGELLSTPRHTSSQKDAPHQHASQKDSRDSPLKVGI
ncbi:hypothetical protein BU16DRAFT_531865, partial [Lophium mytilinum]